MYKVGSSANKSRWVVECSCGDRKPWDQKKVKKGNLKKDATRIEGVVRQGVGRNG